MRVHSRPGRLGSRLELNHDCLGLVSCEFMTKRERIRDQSRLVRNTSDDNVMVLREQHSTTCALAPTYA